MSRQTPAGRRLLWLLGVLVLVNTVVSGTEVGLGPLVPRPVGHLVNPTAAALAAVMMAFIAAAFVVRPGHLVTSVAVFDPLWTGLQTAGAVLMSWSLLRLPLGLRSRVAALIGGFGSAVTVLLTTRPDVDAQVLIYPVASLATAISAYCHLSGGVVTGGARRRTAGTACCRTPARQLQRDDFGTGQSTLSLLATCPADSIKLDRSFVPGPGADAIAGAVIQLARALDIGAVAEGVETAEHVRALLGLGYRVGQGYHFARPMPAAEVEERLARTRDGLAASR
ncbi:hypothetical protein GCM10009557_51210 [Virgisporangium ochraceum]